VRKSFLKKNINVVEEPNTFAESPVANFISGRRGSKRLTSSIVDKTRKWLDDCQDQHQYCPKRCTPKLPKRVLAIAMDGDDSLRLHVSQKEERGEYAALSYCWGGDQQFKTTRSSISAYTKSMSLHLLPNTLRDAVKVCQKMGTRFLWIDSLCIVQDDPEDKNEEIAGMGSIYKNATYSIAAASARTVHEGFLSTAKDDSVLTKLPLYLDQCSSEPIFVRPEGGDISAHEDEPLFNRGWTLQEMILSPRMLVFDSYQLMVKCTESYFEPIVPTSIQLDDTRLGGLGLPSEIFGVASREMMEWNKYRSGSVAQYLKREQLTLWRHLIHEYSRRELTLFTDRLPALAGVAFELWKYWGGTYVAGLWKESLVEHLGWQAGNSDSYGNIHIDIHIDEHIGGLPSWSWITAPYKVLIDNGITPDAKVLDCRVEHLSQDVPFGQVRDASITLEAIILNPADVKFPADLGCRVVAALTELESCAQNVILETTRLLLLGWSLDKGVFLVIKEAENGTYTRIGLTKIKRDKISELLVLTRRMSCVLK
jgi:hypothetical protein